MRHARGLRTGTRGATAVGLVAVVVAVVLAIGAGAGGAAAPQSHVHRFGVVGNRGKIAQLERDTPTPVPGIRGEVIQIATSNSNGYALTSTGQVWAWGVGSLGELGDGKAPRYSTTAVRVTLPAGVRIMELANPMPFDGALAIDTRGNAWGWGLNVNADLCLTGTEELHPVQLPLHDVTLAAGARTHSLFDAQGKVYACGSGQYGVLGTGSLADSAQPTPVTGLPEGAHVTALTASWEGSGALLSTGAYYDWGYNAAGQLGNGTTADSAVPVHVTLHDAVRQVFQGGSGPTNGQSVAILANGSLWAWGNNRRGQLGDGTTANSDVPVQVAVPRGQHFIRVNSGGYASYAINRSGQLWSWGGNQNGQLGTGGTPVLATRPIAVHIRASQVSSTANNAATLTPTASRHH